MSNVIKSPLMIVAAANKLPCGLVVVGVRHCDNIMHEQAKASGKSLIKCEQGFIDNKREFHSRESALAIAIEAGQVNTFRKKTFPESKLFSEDLY